MTKPLKDWTLGEVQEECKQRGAPCASSGCPFYGMKGFSNFCKLKDLPEGWDLTYTTTLTPDELAVCRLLKAGGADRVERFNKSGWLSIYFGQTEVASGRYICLFPSLRPGDTLDLTTMELE